jgi:hypothetical protein
MVDAPGHTIYLHHQMRSHKSDKRLLKTAFSYNVNAFKFIILCKKLLLGITGKLLIQYH